MSESYEIANKDKDDKGSRELHSNCSVVDHRQERDQGRSPPKTEERKSHLVQCESLLRVGRYHHIHCPTKEQYDSPHVNTPTTHKYTYHTLPLL